MKALKATIKPFETPQRTVKIIKLIFISIQLSELHDAGRIKQLDLLTFSSGWMSNCFSSCTLWNYCKFLVDSLRHIPCVDLHKEKKCSTKFPENIRSDLG